MTEGEIKRSYEGAKDKTKQITILAQLNETTEETIRDILKEQGVELRNRKTKNAIQVTDAPAATAKGNTYKLPEIVRDAVMHEMLTLQEECDHAEDTIRDLKETMAGKQKKIVELREYLEEHVG